MSRPNLQKTVLNGVDVSAYVISWETTRESSKITGDATLLLSRNVKEILNISKTSSPGWDVTIQRGSVTATDTYKFRGEIISTKVINTGYAITCYGKYYSAVREEVTKSYDKNIDPEAGKPSEIYKNLINEKTDDLSCDDTTVQDSGTTLVLDKFVCNHADVFERVDALAKAMNWQHYYNPITDKTYFEPLGFISDSTVLTVGENIVEVPEWDFDKEDLINELTVRGAEQEVQKTLFFDGTNIAGQECILDKTPVSVKIYVGTGNYDPTGTGTKPSDNQSNLKIGGKVGSTSGVYDYKYDEDANVKTVYFKDTDTEPSLTPPVGVNNIEVQFTYKLPAPVVAKRDASITAYKKHKKTHTLSDVKTIADAEVYAQNTLDAYSTPFISTTLRVSGVEGLQPGRQYRIVDGVNEIDEFLTILKIKSVYPYKYDEITVGDKQTRESEWEIRTTDRLKRLEELESSSTDLLLHIIDINREINYERRYTQLERRSVAGESGIYGNPIFGVYGTAKYGAAASSTFILGSSTYGLLGTSELGSSLSTYIKVKILQGNNTYKEFLYDEDFLDSDATTADWDTLNKEITFNLLGWKENTDITAGLPTTYQWNTPTVFYMAGEMYMIRGYDSSPDYLGFKWNTTTLQWDSNTAIVNGLVGHHPNVTYFETLGISRLITSSEHGELNGFTWSDSTNKWVFDTAVDNGIPTLSTATNVQVFEKDDELYMICGYDNNTITAYKWNTSTLIWETNTYIINGLVSVDYAPAPFAFYKDSKLYLIMGQYRDAVETTKGGATGWLWDEDNSIWIPDTDILAGIVTTTGRRMRPTIFDFDGNLTMLIGVYTGENYGYTFTTSIAKTSDITRGMTYKYYTVSLGELTGDLLVEISGNGGINWETVILGVKTAFANSDDTGVQIRMTNNSTTLGATIKNTYKTSGEYENAGIKCILEE